MDGTRYSKQPVHLGPHWPVGGSTETWITVCDLWGYPTYPTPHALTWAQFKGESSAGLHLRQLALGEKMGRKTWDKNKINTTSTSPKKAWQYSLWPQLKTDHCLSAHFQCIFPPFALICSSWTAKTTLSSPTTSAADSTCWTANGQLLPTAWEINTRPDSHKRSSVTFWLISAWCVKAFRTGNQILNMYFVVALWFLSWRFYCTVSYKCCLFVFLLTVTTVSLGMLNQNIFIIVFGKSQKSFKSRFINKNSLEVHCRETVT